MTGFVSEGSTFSQPPQPTTISYYVDLFKALHVISFAGGLRNLVRALRGIACHHRPFCGPTIHMDDLPTAFSEQDTLILAGNLMRLRILSSINPAVNR